MATCPVCSEASEPAVAQEMLIAEIPVEMPLNQSNCWFSPSIAVSKLAHWLHQRHVTAYSGVFVLWGGSWGV